MIPTGHRWFLGRPPGVLADHWPIQNLRVARSTTSRPPIATAFSC